MTIRKLTILLTRLGVFAGAALLMNRAPLAASAEACVLCPSPDLCNNEAYSGATDCSFATGKCKLIGEICNGT